MEIINRIIALLLAITCIAIAMLSSELVGPGMWGMIILVSGLFIGISPYFRATILPGRAISILLCIICIGAFVLGMVAGTIGSGLDQEEKLFLFLFLIAGILSGVVAAIQRLPSAQHD